jgi:hypothetical protein
MRPRTATADHLDGRVAAAVGAQPSYWAQLVIPRPRVVIPAAGGMGTAVDMQRLPGQVGRHVGGEKHCDTGNFVDMAGPPQWHDIAHVVQVRFCVCSAVRRLIPAS